ncbi:flagellar hook-associated protein FlgL [Enterovibrio norvegicus]|uniref:Flagellar hook-associated protein 3 n=1 Tax=Enterovibrio norvegicus TaxID=188144 RepID=A0A2N7L5W0_9GAMM|nr:flagellar hook-associated protein FlgL [Enterovibrio norvegicus]PML78014.1 flagellar hook-associated protein 3 [Enterovibrio norvegicus]PMN67282.1 flagellar hook-associated protein 3 [Enterovibrio norvegicus]PMN89022.1 flagellar hook-associated protein 3 [Enterovibrio norvegicus]
MISRIASFHNYQSVSNDLMRQQVKLQDNQDQLATGKRVLTSGDDPVASIYIQNFRQQDKQLDQYVDSITLARNRQTRAEIAIDDSEQLIDSAKRTTMEMINGSLSDDDRAAHKQDMKGLYDNFMNLVNAKDESGNFLFSGTQASKQPFYRDNAGNVRYAGDSYHRTAQIAPAVEVQTSDPGDEVFMEIKNPFGDYQPDYELESGSLLLLASATNTNNADTSDYAVNFSVDGNGQTLYELTQNGAMVSSGVYDPATGVQWGTLSASFEGEMLDGDSISLARQDTFNVFDAFRKGMELSEESIFNASATAELHQVTEQFSAAFKHLNKARSEVGTRLNTLDRQESMHQDFKLVLNRSLGTMEDLDYSTAVIDMNENLLALQASQQAFAKTKDLTLFNYI